MMHGARLQRAIDMDWVPTREQVERGLSDADKLVRLAWINRTDFSPTPKQVETGLTDCDWAIRRAWVLRTDLDAPVRNAKIGLQLLSRLKWV